MVDAESYVPAHELRPVDLGRGVEHFLFNWDDAQSKPYPMARWVTGEGKEAWLSTRALQCLALALSVGAEEGSYRLGISTSTFKKHLTKTFQKLGVMTKWEAASELGWIHIPASLQASLEDIESLSGRSTAGPDAPPCPARPVLHGWARGRTPRSTGDPA